MFYCVYQTKPKAHKNVNTGQVGDHKENEDWVTLEDILVM